MQNTSNIIMYFQFYFYLFSENDGLDILRFMVLTRKRPNDVGFMIWEKPIATIGLNNGYSLSEVFESIRLLGSIINKCH